MFVHPGDPRLAWLGAVSVEQGDGWVMPWRIPHADRMLYNDQLLIRAAMPSGVRLAFRSDTTHVAGAFVPAPDMAPIDICCDGEFVGSCPLEGQQSFRFDGLASRDKLIELWLPQADLLKLQGLELSEGATLVQAEDTRPRWITYGSSITHCRTAASPTQTWPAIVTRQMGLHLTSLGFGGQCHLDPLIARLMRDLPADYLSMCVGINIYGGASLGPRTFRWGIIGFAEIVREKHPDTPFVIMSPIYSPPRETALNAVGFTLQAMREEVAEAVAAMQAHGDRNVHYVNGLDVFGEDLGHLLPDELHPNAEGYRIMGRSFLDVAARRYFV